MIVDAERKDIQMLIESRFDYFVADDWPVSIEQEKLIRSSLEKYFTEQIGVNFFAKIIYVDDELASVAFLSLFDKPANPSFPTGRTATVYNVLTSDKHRGKGYASALVKELITLAKRENASIIELSATEMGFNVYKKLGFELVDNDHFVEMRKELF